MYDKANTCCNEYAVINLYIKLENDELPMTINDLKKVEQYIKEDVSIQKSTIGIVGENDSDLRNTW